MTGFFSNPRRLLIVTHDLVMTAAAMLAAFYFRFEDIGLTQRFHWLLIVLPGFLVYAGMVYWIFKLYAAKWRFASLPDLWNIFRAVTVLALSLLVLDYVLVAPYFYGTFFFGKITILLYWVLQMFFLGGPRIAYRLFRHARTQHHVRGPEAVPTLIAGRAADAEVLLRAIESGAVTKLRPVGILSPSRADQGQALRGVPVRGYLSDLEVTVASLAEQGIHVARLVLSAAALAPDVHPETMLMLARRLGLATNRLPALDGGEDALRLAPVDVEDLLLRPSVNIDYRRLEQFVKGRTVVVTGGGGSIGSEICDRVVTFGAGRLLILENSELALHGVLERLAVKSSATIVEGRIADIRDRERTFRLIAGVEPNLVFHAAALKHVPLVEREWDEGIRTNVLGSINVADATVAAGAQAMVMISTDKAIEPVSVLGATKRLAEMYCQALDAAARGANGGKSPIRMIAVRFGNVLASNGSVVPKFKAQIEAGGPVTVTHPDMVRYFMTIREACDLVITAASSCAWPNADRSLGLCAQHGSADQDRRPRRTDDPVERARAGARRRHRVYRRPARRATQRDPVRARGAGHGCRHCRRRGGDTGLSFHRCGARLGRQAQERDRSQRTRRDRRSAARSRAGFPQRGAITTPALRLRYNNEG